MFKLLMILATSAFFMNGSANATEVGIPTLITNADKFQLNGALVVSNTNSNAVAQVRQSVVPLNISSRTMAKCEAAKSAACNHALYGVGVTSYITNSWETQSYCVVLGDCVEK